MRLRDDFAAREVVDTTQEDWVPSPSPGVERKMLDRIGGEVARATSLVRYAASSRFPAHTHGGGEEFLVLEGVFSDEHGDYPAGTYVRNPPGSSHAPTTELGCTLFVKLRQFSDGDDERVILDTTKEEGWSAGVVPGHELMPLHTFGSEEVVLERWAGGTRLPQHRHAAGEEILLLEGDLEDEGGAYAKGSWIRLPAGSEHAPSTEGGCLLWVKRGHLPAAAGKA